MFHVSKNDQARYEKDSPLRDSCWQTEAAHPVPRSTRMDMKPLLRWIAELQCLSFVL
jgi:hypothetical protein